METRATSLSLSLSLAGGVGQSCQQHKSCGTRSCRVVINLRVDSGGEGALVQLNPVALDNYRVADGCTRNHVQPRAGNDNVVNFELMSILAFVEIAALFILSAARERKENKNESMNKERYPSSSLMLDLPFDIVAKVLVFEAWGCNIATSGLCGSANIYIFDDHRLTNVVVAGKREGIADVAGIASSTTRGIGEFDRILGASETVDEERLLIGSHGGKSP